MSGEAVVDAGDRLSRGVWHAVAVVAIILVLSALTVIALFVVGLTQWLGLLPLFFWERSKGRPQAAKGVLIVGGVVFLLQAACYGIVLSSGLNMH